jgi:Ca-activated chloride channel family protein
MRASAVLAIAALAAVPLAARQQAPVQFKSSTEVVSVYTTVHDRSGRLVPDLQKEDFVVLDNGKEQPLTHFSNEATPFTAVVMLDQSGSMRPHRDAIVDAASAFVRQLTPVDKARIGRLGWRIQIEPPQFTSRQEDLLQVLRQVVGDAGASPVWLSVDQSITALYGLDGRRVILLMSDGQDAPADNQRQANFKDVVDRLRRANVMVYAIGFSASEYRDGRTQFERPSENLRKMADISGGGYFEMTDTSDMARLFVRVAEELHHQYWLGFEPTKRDGKVHEIQVRIKKQGMTARARQSYLAPVTTR